MGNDDLKGAYSGNNSDTKESIIGSDKIGAPVRRTSRKSSGKNIHNEANMEVLLEIQEDLSITVQNVQTVGGEQEDPELTLLAKKTLEKKSSSSLGSSLFRSTSQHIRQVSQELIRLASHTRKTSFTSKRFDHAELAAVQALKGLKFITTEKNDWSAVEKRFDEFTSSTNGLLLSAKFGECIGMNNNSKEFASELFRALARKYKTSGGDCICCTINKAQLKDFWDQISDESSDSRLRTFLDMIDKDADGIITKNEVKEIISLSASANKLSNIQKQAEEYAEFIVEVLDPDQVGYIKVHNLETLLLQATNQSVRTGERQSLIQSLCQDLEPIKEKNPLRRWYQKIKYFLMDNWKRVWIVMLWFGIVSGLFAYKYLQYRNKAAYEVMGYCLCIAKGGAETLKFNMALILLPICRNTITWLRNHTKLGLAVPFDDNLNFHKVIASGIAIGVVLHSGTHLICDFPRLIQASEEEYEPMKPYFGENQPENYWWFLKGVEGVTGIIMVVLMVIAFTLATPWFRRSTLKVPKPFKRFTGYNAFWYSHHLFVIVYALLVVHGIYLYLTKIWYQKTTWMYLAVPVLLYACERLIRTFRSRFKPVNILKVVVYPENVLALHMFVPCGFKYKSGQYIFVKCPTISAFQWHPFSITSAPGDGDLSVHIRKFGDWTCQLNSVFSNVCKPAPSGRSGVLIAQGGSNDPGFPNILIDGPYGAPAQDYKKYEVVLLVGLGIGATPMISIVKDIINNMEKEDNSLESALENGTANNRNINKVSPLIKTRKAYMYWVTKEQRSFEWFREIMNEVAEMDKKRVIELHNYCTSVYEEGDARSALISMLQSLQYAKNGVDVVSETHVKSHFARPNWRQVYKQISFLHPQSIIGVFYCGAPTAMKEIRQLASEFSHNGSTKFDFHKENF
ncbi:hypothetical protein QYF36_026202 [Acer negundo]|nr:hypothetical protein QYF36_026202 [Acer negundo]